MASNFEVPIAVGQSARMSPELVLKRLFDVCVALLIGFMILPVVFLAVVAIKIIDPGSGFFAQNRRGLNGKYFRLFKLRTMRSNGDAWLRDYLAKKGPPTVVQALSIMRQVASALIRWVCRIADSSSTGARTPSTRIAIFGA